MIRKILVVEDEEILRESYRLILSTLPYEVHVAVDGDQALKMCQETDFNLILLDLMMPHVDGPEFLEKFSHLGLVLPRVVVLSNLSSGKSLARAMQLGAHRSVVKADMSPRQLIALVHAELDTGTSPTGA